MECIQETILDNLFDGVYFVNKEGFITYWNKSAELISGYSKSECVGKKCSDGLLRHISLDGEPLCETGCPLKSGLNSGEICDTHIFLHHKNGYRVPVSARMTPNIDETTGEITGAVEIFCNATHKKDVVCQIEEFRQEVLIDPLTGVYNRKHADNTLRSMLRELKDSGKEFGVMFIDLDKFKNVNDTYGHDVGDKVLKMVAKTLQNSLRDFDSICRFGGEEFVVIIPNVNTEVLAKLADRMRIFIKESWVKYGEIVVSVTASIGATVARENDSVKSLVKRADQLMYKSKKEGRDRCNIE